MLIIVVFFFLQDVLILLWNELWNVGWIQLIIISVAKGGINYNWRIISTANKMRVFFVFLFLLLLFLKQPGIVGFI